MNSGKGRLLGALAVMGIAAGVLYYGLSSMQGGPLSFNEGEVSALDGPEGVEDVELEEPAAEEQPGPSMATEVIAGIGPGQAAISADEETAADDRRTPSVATAGPDWATLFEQLMDRERGLDSGSDLSEKAVSPSGDESREGDATPLTREPRAVVVDPFATLRGRSLQGVVARDGEGLVLVDGQMLRVGDVLPGSSWSISRILRDRIQLVLLQQSGTDGVQPELGAELMLAPLINSPSQQQVAAPAEKPAEDDHGTDA